MATIKKFEDLEIWIESRRLSKEIIAISKNTELKNDFKLKAQIKSSSGSVMDNIAEGFEKMEILKNDYEKLSVKIHNFMNYLSNNDFKGTKFIKK